MHVYVVTNLRNGKQYIGAEKGNDPKYWGSGRLIKEAIEKEGKENFKKEVLTDDIDNWDACLEVEESIISQLEKDVLVPNGYNMKIHSFPPPVESQREGGKISGKKAYELGIGIHAPGMAIIYGKIGGKIGGKRVHELYPGRQSKIGKRVHELYPEMAMENGKIGGKIATELKLGIHAPGMQSKGGKKAGKKSYELKLGIHDPANKEKVKEGGKIVGRMNKELKRGFCAPGVSSRGGKIGGRNKARILFEIDGIIQQTTLGSILK